MLLDNSASLPGSVPFVLPLGGRYGVSARREGNGYCFHVPGVGEVWTDADGSLRETRLASDAVPERMGDALTGTIFPLLWTLRGGFLLHGAAVATPHGAVLLFGPSGAGKSTLAAAFEGWAGCRVLDDDAALLEENPAGLRVHPTPRGVSLWEDSLAALGGAFPDQRRLPAYGRKFRARRQGEAPVESQGEDGWPRPGGPGSVPVIAALHLPRPEGADPAQAAFEAMTNSEKYLRLGRSLQRVDLTDRALVKAQFALSTRLAATLPIHRLRFPRAYPALPAVRQAVLDFVRETRP